MSIRPTLLRLQPRATTSALRTAGVRSISSTGPKKAGHGQEQHGSSAEDDTHTHESFLSPPWRNTLILVTASILIYPYLPSPSKISQSPSLSPEAFAQTQTNDVPMVTRLLAKFTPESKIWSERNDRHLEMSTEKAGERLLFQEAERPRVHRMRYPSHFEQASPHCLPVGGSVDLSDLQVKRE